MFVLNCYSDLQSIILCLFWIFVSILEFQISSAVMFIFTKFDGNLWRQRTVGLFDTTAFPESGDINVLLIVYISHFGWLCSVLTRNRLLCNGVIKYHKVNMGTPRWFKLEKTNTPYSNPLQPDIPKKYQDQLKRTIK